MALKVMVAHNRYRSALPSGENTVVDQDIRDLVAAGVTVVPLLRSSDEIPTLPLVQRALVPLGPIWAPWAWASVSASASGGFLREHRPDILHLHNPYPLISPSIVHSAHRLGIPVIQTVHNYRHVCVSGLYFREGSACHDCRGHVFAFPAIRHRCYRGSAAQSVVMAAALAVHRPTWRSVDRFIAPTEAIAAHLRDFGIAAERVVVKPNSVEDPGPLPAAVAASGRGVLFAGRLSEEKGLRLLLEAWPAELGRLKVAGDGPLRDLVEPRAEYLGRLDQAGIRAAIRASALVVVPSIVDDVHPTIVIEALANGRPVLGTRRGGIPELIGAAGWVVEATTDELALGLRRAVQSAPALVEVARRRYLETFTPQRSVATLMEVYASAMRAE